VTLLLICLVREICVGGAFLLWNTPGKALEFKVITKSKQLSLKAATKADMERWIDCLEAVLDEMKDDGG
jgi:hypothetical protein